MRRNIKAHIILKYFLVLTHSQYGKKKKKKALWHVKMFFSTKRNNYSSGPRFLTLKGTGGQKSGPDDLL